MERATTRLTCLTIVVLLLAIFVQPSVRQGTVKAETRKALEGQEGSGQSWCSRFGGYPLGAEVNGVYACGPSVGMADPFDSVGFQCVELSARYLWVAYGKYVTNVPDGADFVVSGHHQLHVPMGVPDVNSVPSPGDIVSISGGATAYGVGHTAVVASVHVSSVGNGTIRLMEQNASPSGWGTIIVRNWIEAYGGEGYLGSTIVSWLRLSGHTIPGPLARNFRYRVTRLGTHTVATSINNSGEVTGIKSFSTGLHTTIQRPFVYDSADLGIVPAPAYLGPSTETVAVNNAGKLAVSANTPHMPSAAFAVSSAKQRWSRLPKPLPHVNSTAALGINPRGDISGWAAPKKNPSRSVGVIWTKSGKRYRHTTLRAGPGFVAARVYASDHAGDGVGIQRSAGGRFYPTVWIHGHSAHLLPATKGGPATPGLASAISLGAKHPHLLTIVGSSTVHGSLVESTAWKVRVFHGGMSLVHVRHLGMISQSKLSTANSLNGKDWIVGDSIAPKSAHGAPFAFLQRPKVGLVPLSLMVSRKAHWTIVDAAGINNYGQVAAEGYLTTGSHRGPQEALLLTPVRK